MTLASPQGEQVLLELLEDDYELLDPEGFVVRCIARPRASNVRWVTRPAASVLVAVFPEPSYDTLATRQVPDRLRI